MCIYLCLVKISVHVFSVIYLYMGLYVLFIVYSRFDICRWPRLKFLHLSHNRLLSLPWSTMASLMTELRMLEVQDNLWSEKDLACEGERILRSKLVPAWTFSRTIEET